MTRIRTIANAAKEIKEIDSNTAITEFRIRQLVNENIIPFVPVGNRKFVNLDEVWAFFERNNRVG